jgi:ribonuclease P/MRP protein subunit POP5
VWAALAFMNRVPVRDGRACVFRVVRVSGTIRKVEEEAVRRARLLVTAARDEMTGGGKKGSSSSANALGALLRSDGGQARGATAPAAEMQVDSDMSEAEDQGLSDDG